MTRINLSVLGPLQVTWEEGRPPRFRSPTTALLLGYLVTESRPVSRSSLITLFWPDHSEVQARGELRRSLHNLATILPNCFQATHQTVAFTPAACCQVDTTRFSELNDKDDVDSLIQAAALYRAEFLEGLFMDDAPEVEAWLLAERERWRLAAVNVLERLSALHASRGEYPQAIQTASRLLTLDPWRESAYQQLMRLLARSGQWNAALNQYRACVETLASELGVAPTPETTALYERIQVAREAPRHNLPPERTPFIGREAELTTLIDRLRSPDCWLVTLVGPGGVGKTRLARQTAARLSNDFLNGARYVSLTAVSAALFLPAAIAEALGIAVTARPSLEEQVLGHLRQQEQLLILDNFEHLLDGVDLVAKILQTAPGIKLLVTSRERLHLREEWVFALDGLPYPNEDTLREDIASYVAVQLFEQNARRVHRNFALDNELEEAARICRLLEGSPLGIELAATQVPVLSWTQVAEEIGRSLDTLTTTWRNAPERHRSLRAVFEHSWRLLSPQEQHVFRQLAVFRGGFTLEVAAGVAGLTPAILVALRAKSFLRETEDTVATAQRYDMHATLHQYAAESLAAHPQEQRQAERQHAYYFAGLLATQEGRFMTALVEVKAILLPEIDNLRLAWQRAVAWRDWPLIKTMVGSLYKLFEAQCWFHEGSELLLAAVAASEEQPPADETRGRLLIHAAALLLRLGQLLEAYELIEQGLPILRRHGSPAMVGQALNTLGIYHIYAGQFEAAETALRACIDLYQQHHVEEAGAIRPLANLGSLYARQGNYAASLNTLAEGLALSQKMGDRWGTALFLNNLAAVHLMSGDATRAKKYLEASLPISEEVGHFQNKLVALQNLAEIHVKEGDLVAAVAVGRESVVLARRLNDRPNLARSLKMQGMAEVRMGDTVVAWEHLREGLETAYANQVTPALLDVLDGIAEWLAATGRKQQATELAHFILGHPATEQQYRDKAQALLVQLAMLLTSEQIAAIGIRPLDEVVNQLLLMTSDRVHSKVTTQK